VQKSEISLGTTSAQSVQRPSVAAPSATAGFAVQAPPPSVVPPRSGMAAPPSGVVVPAGVQSSAPTNLLADFGGDPFAGLTKSAASTSMLSLLSSLYTLYATKRLPVYIVFSTKVGRFQ